MPRALRYGLMIVAIAVILYLVACNFDDVIYSLGRVVFETKGQEERPEDVFGETAVQGGPEAETAD